MATFPLSPEKSTSWSQEAYAMAAHAKVLSGNKLEQLVVRLQRHSGRAKEACWRFIIQHGLKNKVDHRRWTEEELDTLREELVKRSVDDVAKKLNRTPQAIRSALKRNNLSVREIRCDLFSLESLSAALHVGKPELVSWIERGWLPASVNESGRRRTYVITPEGLQHLYKNHLQDALRRGVSNQSLFEAYVQYCFAPKHTVGEQLLDVRRDKRERASFEGRLRSSTTKQEDGGGEDDDDSLEGRYGIGT
jgi:hypothetical protein